MTKYEAVRNAVRIAQGECHYAAVEGGWWDNPITGERHPFPHVRDVLLPQKLLLIHSEISEACEADRKGTKDSHLPHRDGVEVELADAVIRIFDLAGALEYDLGAAIAEKMEYNANRKDHKPAARAAAGGKRY